MAAESRRKLTVLSREYCHLCEDMIAALRKLQAQRGYFDLEIVDVDRDAALKERYDERVPALLLDGVEVCHYRFDPEVLDAHLIAVTRRA